MPYDIDKLLETRRKMASAMKRLRMGGLKGIMATLGQVGRGRGTIERAAPIRISIVTIALNAADALPLTLESIIAQDYPDLEIVVVDGMSWDGTTDALRRYSKSVNRVVVREDAGIYHAMNDSLELLTGEYVLFMNAGDNFYTSDAVSRMVDALEGSPDIFYGNHVYVNQRMEYFKRAAPFELIASRLRTGDVTARQMELIPGHQATFSRIALLRELGFDTRLKISADHEFLFRAHARGAHFQYIDETVCHYHGGGFSAMMARRTLMEMASIYRRFSAEPDHIDAIYFGNGTPFGMPTQTTGFRLAGFYPGGTWKELADQAGGGDWLAAEGADLISPDEISVGLEVTIVNWLAEQSLSIALGYETIAIVPVRTPIHRMRISFDRPVPPGSLVTLSCARSERVGAQRSAEVGCALRRLSFLGPDEPAPATLAAGSAIVFQMANRNAVLPLLGKGWSAPEATHIWSIGSESELFFLVDCKVTRIALSVRGLSSVPDGVQHIEIAINGIDVFGIDVSQGRMAILEIDCTGDAWRAGEANCVLLKPSVTGVAPGDGRDLGICLFHADIV